MKQRKERDGLRLSHAVPEILGTSDSHCPYGHKATDPFIFNWDEFMIKSVP